MCARQPETALIALLRHLLDDGARTRRAVYLMVATISSAAIGVSLLAAVVNLTGGTGLTASIAATASAIVTTRWSSRVRHRKPHEEP
jgi:hypothetical protein